MDKHITLKNILDLYEKEISKNVKNKQRLLNFEKNKMQNINIIYNKLKAEEYYIRRYNIFLIKEPKLRVIMSLEMVDKIINHFITNYALIPKLSKYLDNRNVATRKNLGTEYGIKLIKKYLEKNKKYGRFYILKLDISKYFYNIDHQVLKNMLLDKLTPKEYNMISNIIDSTNAKYINERISKLSDNNPEIPLYYPGKGLPIGNMTSQFLSIYYLSSLDHYIIHDLKLKHYVRYMDDFIIIHHDKEYLSTCLQKIILKLENTFKLQVNLKKTHITNNKEGFVFLGYKFKVVNKKNIVVIRQETFKKIKKKLKEVNYLYDNGYISLEKYFNTISNYSNTFKYGSKLKIKRTIQRYY